MATRGHTLLLSSDWDLCLDEGGNIQTTTGSYGIAQNVANRVRLFTNDAYYYPDRGVPHFVIDLGHKVNNKLITAELERAAISVDGVISAQVIDLQLTKNDDRAVDRTLTGDIRINTELEDTIDVAL